MSFFRCHRPKKASVLIISCWILAILVVFALSVGYRSRFSLKIANFQKNRLKAYLTAKAALSRAILELTNDMQSNNYDSLEDCWSENESVFRKIMPDKDKPEFAVVKYKDEQGKIKFGVRDEEAKININQAQQELLAQLFNEAQLQSPQALALFVVKWVKKNSNVGDIAKKSSLKVPEELLLVFECFYKDKAAARDNYNKIKNLVTVYGAGKVNINTASRGVLLSLANFVASLSQTDNTSSGAQTLVDALINKRESIGGFRSESEITVIEELDPAVLLDKLKGYLTVKSHNFTIIAEGSSSGVVREIKAVYARPQSLLEDGRIVYWHQN
jgi:type II secretory pathway component PulK